MHFARSVWPGHTQVTRNLIVASLTLTAVGAVQYNLWSTVCNGLGSQYREMVPPVIQDASTLRPPQGDLLISNAGRLSPSS